MIKKIKKYSIVFVGSLLPAVASAAGDPRVTLPENGFTDIKSYLLTILTVVMSITGALAVLFIVIGGLQYMTASGDEKKTGVAKKTITYAIIGLLLVILSLAIVNMLKAFTNTVVR